MRQCKVVVFVPDTDLRRVSDAMFAAGAGNIGQYSQCSFRLAGTGTFFGCDSANPTVGQKGRREEVSEWRLTVRIPTVQGHQESTFDFSHRVDTERVVARFEAGTLEVILPKTSGRNQPESLKGRPRRKD